MTNPNGGSWRILVHDPDPEGEDPMLVIATVALPTDVLPVSLPPGSPGWEASRDWVRAQVGQPFSLRLMRGVTAWHIEEMHQPTGPTYLP